MIESIVEGTSHELIKGLISKSGKSEDYAECFTQMMKILDVTHDVTHGNIQDIMDKSDFIDFICSNGGIYVALSVLIFVVFLLCGTGFHCFRRLRN